MPLPMLSADYATSAAGHLASLAFTLDSDSAKALFWPPLHSLGSVEALFWPPLLSLADVKTLFGSPFHSLSSAKALSWPPLHSLSSVKAFSLRLNFPKKYKRTLSGSNRLRKASGHDSTSQMPLPMPYSPSPAKASASITPLRRTLS